MEFKKDKEGTKPINKTINVDNPGNKPIKKKEIPVIDKKKTCKTVVRTILIRE